MSKCLSVDFVVGMRDVSMVRRRGWRQWEKEWKLVVVFGVVT